MNRRAYRKNKGMRHKLTDAILGSTGKGIIAEVLQDKKSSPALNHAGCSNDISSVGTASCDVSDKHRLKECRIPNTPGLPGIDGRVRFNRKVYDHKGKGAKVVEEIVTDQAKEILDRNPELEYAGPAIFNYDKTGGIDVVLTFTRKV